MLENIELEQWNFKEKGGFRSISGSYYIYEYTSTDGATYKAELRFQKEKDCYVIDITSINEELPEEVGKSMVELFEKSVELLKEKTRIKRELKDLEIASQHTIMPIFQFIKRENTSCKVGS